MAAERPSLSVASGIESVPRLMNDPKARPIVCGIWTTGDIIDGQDVFDAEIDEVKFVTEDIVLDFPCESPWRDVTTGKTFVANKGDMLWFPEGVSSILVWSRNLSAFYVEATHQEVSIIARSDAHLASLAMSNLLSKDAFEEAAAVLRGVNISFILHYAPFPMAFKRGSGCHITSLDDRKYLDFASEQSAGMLGYLHPEINKAIKSTVAHGINLGCLEKLHFCNSGTQARTTAFTLACRYTGKTKILAFTKRCYENFAGFGETLITPFEYVIGKFNDIQQTQTVIDDALAAIIVEPVQTGAGVLPTSLELQFLRDTADRTGAIPVFDEDLTSRLHYSGMQGYHGITPGMTLLGNYLGGGLSVGVFGGRAAIMDLLEPRTGSLSHSSTFNDNPFRIGAGAVACGIITHRVIASTNELGDRLRDDVNQFGRLATPALITATGFGSMLGIQFNGSSASKLSNAFFFHMIKEGIYIGRRGSMSLNMMHREEHITQASDAVRRFVEYILQEDWSAS